MNLDPAQLKKREAQRQVRLQEIQEGKTVLESLPATVNIEFSGRCNIWPPCTYCVGKHAPGYQEPPPISEAQLEPYWKYLLAAERVNDTTYGEPLMYPGIDQLIERLGREGVAFGITSNGLLLTEKKARLLAQHSEWMHMCISLNAATSDTYFRHQGKSFEKIIGNIERYIAFCKELFPQREPRLTLSFIVMRSNEHEVMDFVRLARRIGAPGVLFRHLFDLGVDDFHRDIFGHHFAYGQERLAFDDYKRIERQIQQSPEFKEGATRIQFAWNSKDSFLKGESESGISTPCLFPWKFLCIRPLHGFYTPCVYMKKGIAKTNQTVDEVWNGEVMQELRTSLAKGEVPQYCCDHSDYCPLVLEKRAKERRSAPMPQFETGSERSPSTQTKEIICRRVSLPVLSRPAGGPRTDT